MKAFAESASSHRRRYYSNLTQVLSHSKITLMATQSPETHKLISLLKANFDPAASSEIDARIEFRLGDESLLMYIQDQTLTIGAFDESTASKDPEITLFFESSGLAYEIFSGTKEMINAFMNNQLKSDSNLIWVFHILGAFKKP